MAGNREVFDQAMRDGHSAAWDQEWEKAIRAYTRALNEFPKETVALNNIGMAYVQLNQLRDALKAYSRAASLDKNDLVAIENTADILERIGRPKEAAKAYLAAAEILVGRREVQKAIDTWRRAILLVPALVQAHARLATAYTSLKKIDQAVVEYLAVARIMQQRGDFAGALKSVQNALKVAPKNPDALEALDALQTGGELSDSYVSNAAQAAQSTGPLQLDLSEAFSDSLPSDDEFTEEADISSQSNPLEDIRKDAVTLLANAIFELSGDTEDPLLGVRGDRNKIIAHLTKALEAQTREDDKSAVDAYEKAIKAGLDHPAARLTAACIYMDQEDYGQAIKHFKGASANPKYAAGAYYGMGLAYGRADKMMEATEHLLQCLRVIDLQTVKKQHAGALSTRYENLIANLASQTNEDEIMDLAESLVRFLSGPNWMERAHQARRQLSAQSENGVAPLADLLSIPGAEHVFESLELIEKYLRKGYLETALDEVFFAISHAPSYLPMHLKLGEILQRMGRTEAAVTKYSVISMAYQVRGEAEKSSEIMNTLVKLAPMNINVRTELVNLLVAQGKTDDALRQYIDMADVYYQFANLDQCRKTLADALRLAQRSQVDRAWTLQILHRMGDIDMQRLDWRQALRVYEQIKTLASNDEKAHTSLAELYMRMGQNRQALEEVDDVLRRWLSTGRIDPSIKLLQDLLDSYPKEMGLHARIARVYQQSGRIPDAISHYDTLGELQLEANLRKDAIQTIQHILTLNPENAGDYKALLEHLKPKG